MAHFETNVLQWPASANRQWSARDSAAFDSWLRSDLNERYTATLHEVLPDSLLGLVDGAVRTAR